MYLSMAYIEVNCFWLGTEIKFLLMYQIFTILCAGSTANGKKEKCDTQCPVEDSRTDSVVLLGNLYK